MRQSWRGMFPEIRHLSGNHVYVAEFTNGVIKVGCSCNPRSRIATLTTVARKIFGRRDICITRFHITPDLGGSVLSYQAEAAALREVARIAKRAFETTRHSEYFTGITFEDAVAVVGDRSRLEGHAAHFSPRSTGEATGKRLT